MIEFPEVIFMIRTSSGELVTSEGKFAWDNMEEAQRLVNLSPVGSCMLRIESKHATVAKTIVIKAGCTMVYSAVDGENYRPMVTKDSKEISMILGAGKDLLRNEIKDYWFMNEEGKRTKAEEVIFTKEIVKE